MSAAALKQAADGKTPGRMDARANLRSSQREPAQRLRTSRYRPACRTRGYTERVAAKTLPFKEPLMLDMSLRRLRAAGVFASHAG